MEVSIHLGVNDDMSDASKRQLCSQLGEWRLLHFCARNTLAQVQGRIKIVKENFRKQFSSQNSFYEVDTYTYRLHEVSTSKSCLNPEVDRITIKLYQYRHLPTVCIWEYLQSLLTRSYIYNFVGATNVLLLLKIRIKKNLNFT